jgi:hypothetical protein
MGWIPTLGLMACALLLIALARHRLSAPPRPGRVRLVPWTAVMFLALLFALMIFAHLLTLWGVKQN